jgi:hypothetical protein
VSRHLGPRHHLPLQPRFRHPPFPLLGKNGLWVIPPAKGRELPPTPE